MCMVHITETKITDMKCPTQKYLARDSRIHYDWRNRYRGESGDRRTWIGDTGENTCDLSKLVNYGLQPL